MSTGVSDHQRNKGSGNTTKSFNSRINKDHGHEHDEIDSSWRNQHHQQGYGSSIANSGDPYMNSYYGQQSFQYPSNAFGVNEGGGQGQGPWSNGGDVFLGGYSTAGHEGGGPPAQGPHYDGGMFSGGNGGGAGAFGNFGGQPQFGGYGYQHGNGDYSTWGPRKQHYDDYYRDGMSMEQGMGGLSLTDKEKEQQKGKSWATIASQPAKQPTTYQKKKPGMPLMPPAPGTWSEKNGSVAKTPIAAPVQAPRTQSSWERPKLPPQGPPILPPPSMLPQHRSGGDRGFQQGGYGSGHSYGHPPPPPHPSAGHSSNSHQASAQLLPSQPPMNVHHGQHSNSSSHSSSSHHGHNSNPTPPAPLPPVEAHIDDSKLKAEYNPSVFDLIQDGARFFVIKSYSEDDIHRSIKYEIWCSTEHGNKRLDQAFREREGKGPVYLFFSVNSSGHFCGVAQMMSMVDYEASASVWSSGTDKWKGQFKVKWIYVKDVPNPALRHIKLENNEDKPVTNSRDTQEVPFEKGKQVLKIIHGFHHTTSIFDDFIHYEKRQEEEDQVRKTVVHNHHDHHGGGGGSGRGRGRGGGHHYSGYNDAGRDPRDFRDQGPRGGGGGYMMNDGRDFHHGPPMRGGGGGGRDNFFGGGGGGRDFHPRGDHNGRGGRGRPPHMKN